MISLNKYTDSCIEVSTEQISVYFAYKVPIAYKLKNKILMICENVWGTRIADDIFAITGGDTKPHKIIPADAFSYALEKAYNKSVIHAAQLSLLKSLIGTRNINLKEEAKCQRTLKNLGVQRELF